MCFVLKKINENKNLKSNDYIEKSKRHFIHLSEASALGFWSSRTVGLKILGASIR
jgi:hypothetical protein